MKEKVELRPDCARLLQSAAQKEVNDAARVSAQDNQRTKDLREALREVTDRLNEVEASKA